MKINKIVLHVGLEKTGSTTIQETFSDNRDTLYQLGCYYPTSLGIANHTKLAMFVCRYSLGKAQKLLNLQNNNELNEWRNKVKDEFYKELDTVNAEVLVLSCEWLAHSLENDGEFERLIDLLSPISSRVSVVFYIRRQDELAVSRYSTSLKAGATNKFAFPVKSHGLYDYSKLYNNWRKHFTDVKVRLFERDYLYNNDLLSDFFSICGLDNFELKSGIEKRVHNQSLSKQGQQLLREFNKLVVNNTNINADAKSIKEYRKSLSEAMAGKHLPCTKQEAINFTKLFSASNEQLRMTLFPERADLFSQNYDRYIA